MCLFMTLAVPLSWGSRPVDRKLCVATFRWLCPVKIAKAAHSLTPPSPHAAGRKSIG